MSTPVIAVLLGGISSEREVSLGSGQAAAAALRRTFERVEVFDVTTRALPPGLDAATHVVFSTLHGVFGEDGGMQALLEAAGIASSGCDAASSALCFDKQRTKETVAAAGVPVSRGLLVGPAGADAAAIVVELGTSLVVKPNRSGSSVGLHFVESSDELAAALRAAGSGEGEEGCVVEQRIVGREVTVGVLDGESMGVVEIRPDSGCFDYSSKYTKGLTKYLAPAPLGDALTAELQRLAATAFAACGCRDFARMDFIVGPGDRPVLLEVNTLPGLKETSLLPMSARCVGLDFDALVRRMILPALDRHEAARAAGRKGAIIP